MATDSMILGDYESNEMHQLFSRESDLGLEFILLDRSGEDFIFEGETTSAAKIEAMGFKAQRISDWIGLLTNEEIDRRKAFAKELLALPVRPLSEIRKARLVKL